MSSKNPLQQYFRAVKLYTKLPSGTTYYTDVEFSKDGELGIMPMTAKDEMSVRNPDALLNGEAISDIIASCVPGVKNPRKLLTNDIDALMIAIRHATYGDDLEVSTECPECGEKNDFVVNVSQSLSAMEMLDEEYKVSLENGVEIFVKPYGYGETVKALQSQFEQMKVAKSIDSDKISDDERLKVFSTSFKTISNLNLELLTACIIKVTVTDQEVTNKKHIMEFLSNVDTPTFNSLDQLVKDINLIGIKKDFGAECKKCKHKWEAAIDFNPVNFFTES